MASMKDIKTRIRSVESTQQITRAMELVATSKLRHARERVERSRPFHEVLGEAIAGIQAGLKETPSVYSEVRPVKKTCFVVIGGDRGLAGGYNANLHRLVLSLAGSEPYCVLPIGKKPLEQFTRSGAELVSTYFGLAASVGIGDCMQIARLLCDGFAAGRYDRVTVVYTEFRSMLSQVPASADVLPLQLTGDAKYQSATVEDDPAALVAAIVPQYVSGVLYSALCEASASEHGARRTAMNAANKNAGELIDSLVLKYNRARQAAVTQGDHRNRFRRRGAVTERSQPNAGKETLVPSCRSSARCWTSASRPVTCPTCSTPSRSSATAASLSARSPSSSATMWSAASP